jgi:hypothetical protein
LLPRCPRGRRRAILIEVFGRRFIAGLLGLWLAGCAAPTPPSTPAERAANPDSITKDNPGGDAINPVDAALERLLTTKLGRRNDKFGTIEPAFADAKNWKRIRYFGYRTRGGFRYGKDPSYAAAVLIYEEAEDDAPTSCIERFSVKARGIAGLFDLDVGPVNREIRDHRAGVEAVDWATYEKEWEAKELARIAKLKERLATQKKRSKARVKYGSMRRLAFAVRQRQKKQAEAKAADDGSSPDATSTTVTPPASATGAPAAGATATGATAPSISDPPTPPALAPAVSVTPDESAPADPEAQAKAAEAQKKRAERMRASLERRRAAAKKRRAERLAKMTPEEREKIAARRKELEQRRKERLEKMLQVRPAPLPKNLKPGDMPLITTSGQFATLFNRDSYLGAIVAYDSWPGTCLVQGFAVKIGTDKELAERVRTRWIEEMAPILRWNRKLREQPPIKNR